MSKFKAGSYCSIQSFVSQEDPELAELLDKACTLDVLSHAPRRAPGLTFLMPAPGHKIREECKNLIMSNNGDNLRLAADIFQSLIIRDYLPTAASWSKKEDIPNSMFPARKIEGVASTTDGGITIKGEEGNAVLKKNTAFIDGSKRKNIVVWTLVSGVPSRKTAEATLSLKKIMPAKAKGKFGGYMPNDVEIAKLRFRIGVIAENEHAGNIMQGKESACIAHYACGLVKYMKSAHHEAYMGILPALQRDESDFYILVEPHLPSDHVPLVSDNIIEGWWANKDNLKFCNFNDYCTELCADLDAAMPSRAALLEAAGMTESATPDAVKKYYEQVCASNKINGQEVYTSYLADYYRGNCDMRILHDELRFALPIQFREVRSLDDFKDVIQWIGERMHNPKKSALFGKNSTQLFNAFVNSSAFLFVPIKPGEMTDRTKATTNINTAIEKKYFFAGDFESFTRHTRIAEGEKASKFDEIKKSICSGVLSDDQKAELVKFITSNQ